MKIRLEEYSRGARVRLSVDDAPMTAVRGLVDAFVRALTEVGEKQEAEPKAWTQEYVVSLSDGTSPGDYSEAAAKLADDIDNRLVQEEAPAKKRGRPKKVETAVTAPEPVATTTEAAEEPGLPFTTSSETETDTGAESEAPSTTTSEASSSAPEVLSETTLTPEQPPTAPADDIPADIEITDSELQRYCAKLAQHFGTPQTVFDLAGKFVPEGAVARPTNIRDNSQRWAFVQAAEEQSGVRYLG